MAQRSDRKPPRSEPAARLSITIPADDYTGLKETADRKRVSIAWVVRDAVHTYLQRRTGRNSGRQRDGGSLPATTPHR